MKNISVGLLSFFLSVFSLGATVGEPTKSAQERKEANGSPKVSNATIKSRFGNVSASSLDKAKKLFFTAVGTCVAAYMIFKLKRHYMENPPEENQNQNQKNAQLKEAKKRADRVVKNFKEEVLKPNFNSAIASNIYESGGIDMEDIHRILNENTKVLFHGEALGGLKFLLEKLTTDSDELRVCETLFVLLENMPENKGEELSEEIKKVLKNIFAELEKKEDGKTMKDIENKISIFLANRLVEKNTEKKPKERIIVRTLGFYANEAAKKNLDTLYKEDKEMLKDIFGDEEYKKKYSKSWWPSLWPERLKFW